MIWPQRVISLARSQPGNQACLVALWVWAALAEKWVKHEINDTYVLINKATYPECHQLGKISLPILYCLRPLRVEIIDRYYGSDL